MIGLDFVSRLGPMWAWGIAHGGSLDCLGNGLGDSDPKMAAIVLAHHPLLSIDEYRARCALSCFPPADFQTVLNTIRAHRGTGPREIVSFGGHVHGYRGVPGGNFDANRDFPARPAEGIRVVITEATMVGSNGLTEDEAAWKGFIRIVHVEDEHVYPERIEGYGLPALNPDMRAPGLQPAIFWEDSYTDRGIDRCEWDFDGDGQKDRDGCFTRWPWPSAACLTVTGKDTTDPAWVAAGAPEKITERVCRSFR